MKRVRAKREYIVEFHGFASVWCRSREAPGVYTKDGASRHAKQCERGSTIGIKYRVQRIKPSGRGHKKSSVVMGGS